MAGAQMNPGGVITREAARDLEDYQYHAMQITSGEEMDYANTAGGDSVLGILQNKPDAAGKAADVATEGTSLLRVDGNSVNIAPGDKLGSNSSYHGVKVTADKAVYFCIALEPSAADNDLIEVKLVGESYLAA